MKVTLFAGDITEAPAEAICTSTNPRLSLMMGTGGAVRERGGFEVLRACEAVVETFGRPLPPGSAHVTSAGSLPYKGIIHCVAGDDSHRSSPDIIRLCVRSALGRAVERGWKRLAMPVFATGHAHVPFDRAFAAMSDALRAAPGGVEEVVIVVFDDDLLAEAQRFFA
jgi:O-acetyl-ADP-ribose deacetylase (regulator of RNase III)